MQLQPHWDGNGDPPVQRHPPFLGMPDLETNHPFHFRMNPGLMEGPECNHDVGVLIRCLSSLPAAGDASDGPEADDRIAIAVAAMLEAMGHVVQTQLSMIQL